MDGVPPFEHAYRPGDVVFGRGCVAGLDEILAERGVDRGLVVCGSNVGANADTMRPVEAGLGDRFAGVCDGTTPDKSVDGVYEGLAELDDRDADGVVAVGGGSTHDVARAMRIVHADYRPPDELRELVAERGHLPVPDADLLPLVSVPTTLAGADLSIVGSVTVPADGDEPLVAGFSDPALMPDALCYDPELFETTPAGALAGSAMNGFDKGIEMLYSRNRTPITDATALRGLRLLRRSLPRVVDADDDAAMENVVAGVVLVQYGLSAPGAGKLSVIHAFGHGLRERGIQQGLAHAVMAPRVLEHVFERVDGRRDLLADAFDVDASDPGGKASGVVAAVEAVRDGLGLPSRLRDLDDLEREALPDVAAFVAQDRMLANNPPGLSMDREEILTVLQGAW